MNNRKLTTSINIPHVAENSVHCECADSSSTDIKMGSWPEISNLRVARRLPMYFALGKGSVQSTVQCGSKKVKLKLEEPLFVPSYDTAARQPPSHSTVSPTANRMRA